MSAYRSLVLNDEPKAFWRLGETSGTSAADTSGNGRTGTYVNTPTLGVTGALAGDPDKAATFADASAERVTVADHADLRPTSFSVSMWVNKDGASADYRMALSKTNTGWTNGFGIYFIAGAIYAFASHYLNKRVGTAMTLAAWHHVVMTFNATTSTLTLYVDGALIGTVGSITLSHDTGALLIGSEPNFVNNWNGSLDDVTFFDYVLTAAQVQRYYAQRQYTNRLYIIVDGTHRGEQRNAGDAGVRMESFNVFDAEGQEPTTCGFDANFEIVEGHRVLAFYEGAPKVRFAGTVRRQTLIYDASIPADTHQHAECIDDTWKMNTRKLFARYIGRSLTYIVLDLMTKYAPDVPVDNVEADLPVIDEISFTCEDLTTCLSRGCERVGAYWRRDPEEEGLRVFLEDTDTVPDPLDASAGPISLTYARDIGPMITRMLGEGAGSRALADVPVGESMIPVESVEHFNADGGQVKVGPQIIDYDGIDEGGEGSLVGPGVQPSNAPTLALASGAGVDDGEHDVTVVFVTGAGRTEPSPVATIEVGNLPDPTVAPTVGTPTTGYGPDPGAHEYAYTEVTAAGETEPSPVSASATTTAGATAPTAPTASIPAPASWGQLTVGHQYSYKIAYADIAGRETEASTATGTVTIDAAQRALLSGVPYSTDPRVKRIYFYRSANGGGGPWTRINIGDNATGTTVPYVPNYAPGGTFTVDDWQAAGHPGNAAPSVNATGNRIVPLTFPASTSPLVLSKNIYGTAAGGAQLKQIATGVSASATSYSVTTPDASLGSNAPSSNTADANQIAVSGISIGPSGTTSRELYMSPAGGGARKRALTIANNTDTTGTITMSDATLAGQLAEPSSDTSGLTQPTGTVNPGDTEVPVAGLAPFRSGGGWADAGIQRFKYTGFTGSSLTGVPASGPGAITAPIGYNTSIAAAPLLHGISTGSPGVGSIAYDIVQGDDVNLWVVENDTDAQVNRAAILDDGSDGVVEDYLQNRALSEAELRNRLRAMLTAKSSVEETLETTRRDPELRAGGTLSVNLGEPVNVVTELKIQTVAVTSFGDATDPSVFPPHQVTASSRRYSLQDLLRREQSR